MRRLLALAGLSAVLVLLLIGASRPGAAPQGFSDKLFVREIEVVTEPLLRTDPADFLVTEDGLLRPVTKAGALTPPWRPVVWIDRRLASPETVFRATLALSGQSDDLAKLGDVEIVVADPAPRVELAPSHEPLRLRESLAALAGQARIDPERGSGHYGTGPGPDAATLRRQMDRLLTDLAERRGPGPGLLFWVADGFTITPEEANALNGGLPGATLPERVAILRETARLLAGYGWTVVALPVQSGPPGKEHREGDDLDRFRVDHGNWGSTNNSVPPPTVFRRKKSGSLNFEDVVEALVRPSLAPIQALLEPTAGMVVTHGERLGPTLEAIAGRGHLFFQTQMPMDGRLRPLDIRLRDGRPVRARLWVRSSAPEGIAEARLRELLDGDRLPRSLPLTVDARPAADPSRIELRLAVGAFVAPGPAQAAPVRISIAFAGDAGPFAVHHEMADGIEDPAKGWRHTLTVPVPAGARRLAVVVEDLPRERWAGQTVDPLPAAALRAAPR
jgi:hypothetical protein